MRLQLLRTTAPDLGLSCPYRLYQVRLEGDTAALFTLGLLGLAGAGEVGRAHEEALGVVVSVNEPAGSGYGISLSTVPSPGCSRMKNEVVPGAD